MITVHIYVRTNNSLTMEIPSIQIGGLNYTIKDKKLVELPQSSRSVKMAISFQNGETEAVAIRRARSMAKTFFPSNVRKYVEYKVHGQ